MTSPLTDATAVASSSPLQELTPRQKIENALGALPAAGSQLSQANADPSISAGALVEPIQRINNVMRPHGIEFDISDERSRIVTRVIDRDSGDVIRQIPAEEVLRIADSLESLQGQLISLEV